MTEEMELVIDKDAKGWWQITVTGPTGLVCCVKADPVSYPTPKHAAWHVREAMDGLLLASGKDGEHVNPGQVRERQRAAFRPTRTIRGRKR